MPSFILKAAPDADVYVEWSTVVDNLTGVGTSTSWPADRIARADATGTSCKDPDYRFGGWDDQEHLLVHNTERMDALFFLLKRSDLLAYAQAYLADDVEAAEALLTPVERCDSCDADGVRLTYSEPHTARFCDGCFERENGRKPA